LADKREWMTPFQLLGFKFQAKALGPVLMCTGAL